MKTEKNAIGFVNAEGGTGRVAPLVRDIIFPDFPTVDVLMDVETRIATKDACVEKAVEIFLTCGSGFKNSTASDTEILKENGMSSANKKFRTDLGAYAIERIIDGPGRYKIKCGVLRYMHGDIYDEVFVSKKVSDGQNSLLVIQSMNTDDLIPFAKLAKEISDRDSLDLILATKSSICESENLFRKTIEEVWFTENAKWQHKLTDTGLSELPVISSGGTNEGGFLFVTGNANGDSAASIVDHQHGNYVMTSALHCLHNKKKYIFEELSGGTADIFTDGPLSGDTFLNPFGIILGFAKAFKRVNPSYSDFFDAVKAESISYIEKTPLKERDTLEMIHMVSNASKKHLI